MCKVISLEKYRNKKQETMEDPNTISDVELAELEESIWQACQALGLDQFFMDLFAENMPRKEDTEKG